MNFHTWRVPNPSDILDHSRFFRTKLSVRTDADTQMHTHKTTHEAFTSPGFWQNVRIVINRDYDHYHSDGYEDDTLVKFIRFTACLFNLLRWVRCPPRRNERTIILCLRRNCTVYGHREENDFATSKRMSEVIRGTQRRNCRSPKTFCCLLPRVFFYVL